MRYHILDTRTLQHPTRANVFSQLPLLAPPITIQRTARLLSSLRSSVMSSSTPPIHRVNGELYVEGVSCTSLAKSYGTPLYVYSRRALTDAYKAYASSGAKVHVAVKANSNLGVLSLFARLGAGFDIVSGGELARVLAAGGKASDVVFSGVGKSADEMRYALREGVKCFNVESAPELERLDAVAGEMGLMAPVSLRVNPDVDPKTHPYISTGLKGNKFGVAFSDALKTYKRAQELANVDVRGIDCHIGSQITDISPYLDALDRVLDLVAKLKAEGIDIAHIDVGGGLGIDYGNGDAPPKTEQFVSTIIERMREEQPGAEVWFEPGRSLLGNAGVLLTTVEYLKPGEEKNFCIVDAGMNDLARPSMYDAFHDIVPVSECSEAAATANGEAGKGTSWEVVGPVCESGDWLGHDRSLDVKPGDVLAILSAGAYGFTMASNYNTRPRPTELVADGEKVHVVRERETVQSLFAGEKVIS